MSNKLSSESTVEAGCWNMIAKEFLNTDKVEAGLLKNIARYKKQKLCGMWVRCLPKVSVNGRVRRILAHQLSCALPG